MLPPNIAIAINSHRHRDIPVPEHARVNESENLKRLEQRSARPLFASCWPQESVKSSEDQSAGMQPSLAPFYVSIVTGRNKYLGEARTHGFPRTFRTVSQHSHGCSGLFSSTVGAWLR